MKFLYGLSLYKKSGWKTIITLEEERFENRDFGKLILLHQIKDIEWVREQEFKDALASLHTDGAKFIKSWHVCV